MALFDKQKMAEKKEARGERMAALVNVTYMGGYDDKKKALGNLVFYQKQIEFSSPLSTKITIATNSVRDVAIEGKDDVSKRVTVTRLLAVGIFAFALKKKSKDTEAYLTLVMADGQEAVFFVDKTSPMALKTKLAKAILQTKQANPIVQPIGSIADELAKLAALKDQGVLTQAEFDKKKQELLG